MAFPVIAGSALSNAPANSTAHNVTLPASIAAGDLIIAWVFNDLNPTFTWPSPWVEIFDQTFGGATGGAVGIAYLIASGGETTVQVTSSVSERSAHISVRITGWHGTTPPEISTSATSSGTTPDPDSLTASWGVGDTLWIAWYGVDFGIPTAYPLPDNNISSEDISSSAHGGICSSELAQATLNPGTFTNNQSDDWRAGTIAVRASAAVGIVPIIMREKMARL